MNQTDKEEIIHLRKFAPKFFRTLRNVKGEENIYQVKIQFSSYVELLCVTSDLLKLCITEEEFEAEGASPYITGNPNIRSILELVLQFLPMEEAELLDEIRPLLLRRNPLDTTENLGHEK